MATIIDLINSNADKKELPPLSSSTFSTELNIVIEITNQKIEHTFPDDAKGFIYKSNIIVDNNKTVDLFSVRYDKILEIQKNKRINLEFRLGISNSKIEFPREMSNNFAAFLTGERRKGANCLDFVNDLLFGCGTQRLQHIHINSGDENQSINDLTPGQAIVLGNVEKGAFFSNKLHYAISLFNNLFLSVLGDDGPICITTLEQLKSIYKIQNHFLINRVTPVGIGNEDIPWIDILSTLLDHKKYIIGVVAKYCFGDHYNTTTISALSDDLQKYLQKKRYIYFSPTCSINIKINDLAPLFVIARDLHEHNRFDFIEEFLNKPDIKLNQVFKPVINNDYTQTVLTVLLYQYDHYKDQPSKDKIFELIKNVIILCPEVIYHNRKGKNAYSDLFSVAMNNNLPCLKLMVQYGCNVDLANENGLTALYWAAVAGHTNMCQFLIDRHANLDAGEYEHGGNALHALAYFGEPLEKLEFLLTMGFKYNQCDKYNFTPFRITQTDPEKYPEHIREEMQDEEFIEKIEAAQKNRKKIGEKLQAIDRFFNAVTTGDFKVAEELLKTGVPVNARNAQGKTALHIACQSNFPAITQLLINNGAKLTKLDDEKHIPFNKNNSLTGKTEDNLLNAYNLKKSTSLLELSSPAKPNESLSQSLNLSTQNTNPIVS